MKKYASENGSYVEVKGNNNMTMKVAFKDWKDLGKKSGWFHKVSKVELKEAYQALIEVSARLSGLKEQLSHIDQTINLLNGTKANIDQQFQDEIQESIGMLQISRKGISQEIESLDENYNTLRSFLMSS